MFSVFDIALGLIGLAIFVMLVLALINRQLPIWFCNIMGWHLRPDAIGFDGTIDISTEEIK